MPDKINFTLPDKNIVYSVIGSQFYATLNASEAKSLSKMRLRYNCWVAITTVLSTIFNLDDNSGIVFRLVSLTYILRISENFGL